MLVKQNSAEQICNMQYAKWGLVRFQQFFPRNLTMLPKINNGLSYLKNGIDLVRRCLTFYCTVDMAMNSFKL